MADYSDYLEPGALAAAGLRMAWPFIKRVGGPLTAYFGDTKPLNVGEQDLYVRGPDGKMMPNPNNPAAAQLAGPMASGSPMNPMPASSPFPTDPNGRNPADPSVLQRPGMFPSSGFNPPPAPTPPSAPPQAAASPAAASASPSPSPGLPAPQAPEGAGGAGGFNPPLPRAFQQTLPSFYNGPGSMSFGAGDQAPGGLLGALSAFSKGGTDASNFIQRLPDKPGDNMLRMFTNNGQLFAPGWTASNKWYNN